MSESDDQRRFEESSSEVGRLRAENERLRTLLGLARETKAILESKPRPRCQDAAALCALIRADSPAAEKLALMRSLFHGRDDIYAVCWENVHTGRSGYAPAVAGGWRGTRDAPKSYLPLTDDTIDAHLRGRESIGIYPLLKDDRCRFLVCDLDGSTWSLDALAFLETCTVRGVPAALERSRSGDGAHVWIFFSAPVAAADARRLGALLLRETMARRAEVDLASYDRLLPNQDCAFYAGLRRGELRALLWSDVDLAGGVIRVERSLTSYGDAGAPKSRAGRRSVPIVAALRDLLVEHKVVTRRATGLVFGSSAGSPFTPTAVRRRALTAWRRSGAEPIGLHECRHTFASLLIAAGVNPKAITAYLGHASIQTTFDLYGHLMPGNEDEAVALVDAYLERANTDRRLELLSD